MTLFRKRAILCFEISQHKETMYGPTKVVLMGVNTDVASEINAALG